MKLYFVIIKNGAGYWVMAEDTESAYKKLRETLDENDWFYESQRELKHIDVIGEEVGKDVYKEDN